VNALIVLLLAAPAWAAPPTWSVAAATSAAVGTETTVAYRVSVPPGSNLTPNALASSTSDFLVLQAAFDPAAQAWLWTLLPIGEGRLSFTSRWSLGGESIEAPPVALTVRTPDVAPEEQPSDIKPPRTARPALWPWLLAALLAAGAVLAWKRWKNRATPLGAGAPAAPGPSAEERARRALQELAASGLWEKGEHAAYYLWLTDLLREYLEARYDEPATAMTSGEVASLVRGREADLRVGATVRTVLQRADLVKFARTKPDPAEGPRDAELVLAVVDATTRAPLASPAEETAA